MDCARRAAREGPESVQPVQFGEVIVAGSGPCRVVRELVPVEAQLTADEVHDRARHELARSQQTARVAQDAQLQREAQLVARPPPGVDVLQILVAQRVVPQQVRLAFWQGEQGRPLPAGKNRPVCHRFFLQPSPWCRAQCHRPELLPKSPLAKALNYALERHSGLEVFLNDPEVAIDTIWNERYVRFLSGNATGSSLRARSARSAWGLSRVCW